MTAKTVHEHYSIFNDKRIYLALVIGVVIGVTLAEIYEKIH